MDEQDLRSVLRDHDARERGLLPAERARVLARLEGASSEPSEFERAEVDRRDSTPTNGIDITPAVETQDRHRPPIWMAAAATLIVLTGLFFLVGPRTDSGDVSVVAEVDAPTPAATAAPAPTPVPPSCPAAVEAFVLAVDGWDGIERWASLIDERRPDPDLPTLAAAALVEWRALSGTDPLLVDVDIDLEEFSDASSESASDTAARRSAPLQLAFDRMRSASLNVASPLAPCTETIETVAQELGLQPPPSNDG